MGNVFKKTSAEYKFPQNSDQKKEEINSKKIKKPDIPRINEPITSNQVPSNKNKSNSNSLGEKSDHTTSVCQDKAITDLIESDKEKSTTNNSPVKPSDNNVQLDNQDRKDDGMVQTALSSSIGNKDRDEDHKDHSDLMSSLDKEKSTTNNSSVKQSDDNGQQDNQDGNDAAIVQTASSSAIWYEDHKDHFDSMSSSDKEKSTTNNSSVRQSNDNGQQDNQVDENDDAIVQTASSSPIRYEDHKDHSDSMSSSDKEKFTTNNSPVKQSNDNGQQDNQDGNDAGIDQTASLSPIGNKYRFEDYKDHSDSMSSPHKEKSTTNNYSVKQSDDNGQQDNQDGNDAGIDQTVSSSPIGNENRDEDHKDHSDSMTSPDKEKSTKNNFAVKQSDDNGQQDNQDGNDAGINQTAPLSLLDYEDYKDHSDSMSSLDKEISTTDNSLVKQFDVNGQQDNQDGNDAVVDQTTLSSSLEYEDYKDHSDSMSSLDKEISTTDNSLVKQSDDNGEQDNQDDHKLVSKISQKEQLLVENNEGHQSGNNVAYTEVQPVALPMASVKNSLSSKEVSADNGSKEECQNETFASEVASFDSSSTKLHQKDYQKKSDSAPDKLLDKCGNSEDKNNENNKGKVYKNKEEKIDEKKEDKNDVSSAVAENQNSNTNQPQSFSEDIDNTEMKIISLDDKFTFNPKKLNLDKKSVEYINAIMKEAEKYKEQVESFSNTSASMEHFILDENLMQLVDHLDKIKCKKGEEQYAPKIAALKYIQKLQDKLDDNTISEEETT